MGGIFFAFSAFIMKALGRLPPAQGIAAMRSINVTVINPLFMTAFFGPAAGCVVLTVSALLGWQRPSSVFLIVGSLLYLFGTILVTGGFNVPRNNALGGCRLGKLRGGPRVGKLPHCLDGLEPRADGRSPCCSRVAHHCAPLLRSHKEKSCAPPGVLTKKNLPFHCPIGVRRVMSRPSGNPGTVRGHSQRVQHGSVGNYKPEWIVAGCHP